MKLSPLLLLILILPVENQLLVDDDQIDYLQAWNGHFANPVIHVRSFMVIAVNWMSHFIAWVLLGSVWAHIRGDQYDYNLNSTVLFNYAMSDTKAFQNTIKAGSFQLLIILIWNVLAGLGSPIEVPKALPDIGQRGKREAVGDFDNIESVEANVKFPPPSFVPPSVSDQSTRPPSFLEDVLIPAINMNLEPNGIGRNTLITTVIAMAQTVFWLACALFLPQIGAG